MIYAIDTDTDSLIALRRNYPLGDRYFKTLWDDIEKLSSMGNLISTIINYEELKVGDDLLFKECKTRFKDMFIEVDADIQTQVAIILNTFPDLIDPNLDKEQADPYLIATAIVKKAIVITEEQPLDKNAMNNPNRKSKMKIPNVCSHYGIDYTNIVGFINNKEWRKLFED